MKRIVVAAMAISLLGSSGCLLTAAGIVEATKSKPKPDPMGNEYTGVDGEIGWHFTSSTPDGHAASLLAGMNAIGCDVGDSYVEGTFTKCPRRPALSMSSNGKHVYRLCEPGSERMQCRMAWEAVHNAVKLD